MPIKRDTCNLLSSGHEQEHRLWQGRGIWWEPERQKGSAALGPVTRSCGGWEVGVAPANYKAIAAFPGNKEAPELL